MSAIYELQLPPRPSRSERRWRQVAIVTLVLLTLLAWSPAPHGSQHDSVQAADVGAGARDAALEDGTSLAELAAPQLLGARLERNGEAVVLSFELDRSVPHWLERNAGGSEVALILEAARLAQPLDWLDLAGTPIRYLDIRRVGDALHLVLGLDSDAVVDVQSAMLDLSAGARLVVQVAERAAGDRPLRPALVSKRALGTTQDAYREALRLDRAGDTARSLDVLRTLLARHPEHAQGRARLVDELAAAGRPAEALRVLRAGPAPAGNPRRAKLEARLLVEQRAEPEAIAVLERALPPAGEDPEYDAFLAALLQRSGAHEGALALFGSAVNAEPGRADWWLGRAISEDAQGEGAAALLSLKRALALGGLEPEPQRWAEGRARVLEADAVEKKP